MYLSAILQYKVKKYSVDKYLHKANKKRTSENFINIPANIYLFKVNNRNTRKSCEICLKLTIKTPERRH